MRIRRNLIPILPILLLTVKTLFAQDANDKRLEDALKNVTAGKDSLPGPRTCFRSRGPSSGDPYINVAYPDAATFYWAAVFTIPAGAKLTLEGKFPHAR